MAVAPTTAPRRPPPHHPRSPGNSLLLGMGNDLLGDDGIGLRLVRHVRDCLRPAELCVIRETTESGLSLLDELAGFDHVWIVDAVVTHRFPPGHLHHFDSRELPVLQHRRPHGLGLGDTLELGRLLGIPMPRQVEIFAIEIADPCMITDHLSPCLERALPGLAVAVAEAIRHAGP